ncbi:hypothetical protein Golomagni_06084 [Golovinomyces magnicellulatus]|nr:hypothetical protein Golomagni_06084 [Golovinomyces magnicellulatus]
MLVSLTVGKVDAGVTVLLTPDKRLIEFPSILLPPNISSGSIVDITVAQNSTKESAEEQKFRSLQERIFSSFGASEPTTPALRCRNATQTSVMHSTKISGLAVDTEYTFHLILRTSAGTRMSDKVTVRTHKMTDLSGITITTGILPSSTKENLAQAVERIGAKIVDSVRIDTTHFVTTEGRGTAWEKAVETNIPVVRPEWVEACEKNGRILGVTKFYLDAMRPGPPSEESQTPPAVPAKDSTPASTTNEADKSHNDEEDESSDGETEKQDEKEQEKDENEEEYNEKEEAVEPKVKSPHPDEQKMRLEDKQEQKVALRPSTSSRRSGTSKASEEAEEEEDEKEASEKPSPKPTSSPDGASFQEVGL